MQNVRFVSVNGPQYVLYLSLMQEITTDTPVPLTTTTTTATATSTISSIIVTSLLYIGSLLSCIDTAR